MHLPRLPCLAVWLIVVFDHHRGALSLWRQLVVDADVLFCGINALLVACYEAVLAQEGHVFAMGLSLIHI